MVFVRRVDGTRLGANHQRDERTRLVHGQDSGADPRHAGVDRRRVGRPHGVERGLSRCGEHALAHVRRRFQRRNGQRHRGHSVVQAGDLRCLLRRQRVETSLESRPLVRVERADGIGKDEGFELVGDHMTSSSRPRIVARPARMRVFTVPSGTPNRAANSVCV